MNPYFLTAWVCWVVYFLADLKQHQLIQRQIERLEESNRRLWAANQSLTNCILDLHPGQIVIDDQRESEFLQ